MIERIGETRLKLDYSRLPVTDPYSRIAPERKLTVFNGYNSILVKAEANREQRIKDHQIAATREGVIMDQRRAEMEERKEIPIQREIAA